MYTCWRCATTSYSASVSVDFGEVLSPSPIGTGSGVVATVGDAGSVGCCCCCWAGGWCCWWGVGCICGWAYGRAWVSCCCDGVDGGSVVGGLLMVPQAVWGLASTSPCSSIEFIMETSLAFFSACSTWDRNREEREVKHIQQWQTCFDSPSWEWRGSMTIITMSVYTTVIPDAEANISSPLD